MASRSTGWHGALNGAISKIGTCYFCELLLLLGRGVGMQNGKRSDCKSVGDMPCRFDSCPAHSGHEENGDQAVCKTADTWFNSMRGLWRGHGYIGGRFRKGSCHAPPLWTFSSIGESAALIRQRLMVQVRQCPQIALEGGSSVKRHITNPVPALAFGSCIK